MTDNKGLPLAYANVTLLKSADSSFVSAVLTNTDGSFVMALPAAGSYWLRLSAIGFKEKNLPAFDPSTHSFTTDLGSLTLVPDEKLLKDVTITTLRPLITQLPDRMVVSVQGTALAAGSTAFDVLGRAPGVFIDHEGNIQLNGRSGVTVMLDNKLTYLSANDLRNLLQSMPAENLKNIEIITNPSSRYDAEGSSGILNINLKKNNQNGMNGSVYAGYNYNGKQHGYSSGVNVNVKKGSWNSFIFLDQSRRVGGREATFTRIFYGSQGPTYFDQTAIGNFYAQGPPSIRLGTDYSFNERHSIGLMANYNTNKSKSDFLTETWMGDSPAQPDLFIDADNISSNRHRNFTSNFHYTGKLDTSGTLLSSDLDYVRIRNHSRGDFLNYYTNLSTNQTTTDFLYTDIPSGFDIYSAKIDLTLPFRKERKMELGVKASHVVSDNDSRFYFNNGSLVLDPKRTNHFNYQEQIYAAYINYSGTLSKSISYQGGLRAEHTRSTGNSITTGQVTPRTYTNLFPSIFIQQNVNEQYGITWSYSRRIQRPNYGSLNPFRFYRDPYTYVEGNPFLRPQYAHVISITQNFRKQYNLVMTYQLNKDFMSELPRLLVDSATTVYYTGNVDGNYNIGLTAIIPVRISKKWDVQNTANLFYNKYSIEVDKKMLVNDQLYYSLQSAHTIILPAEIRMEMNILYQGPAAYGLYQIAPRYRFDLGFKKSFFKKKLDLTLNVVDLFKTQRLKFKTDINGNVNDFDQYLRPRFAGINLRYHFSKGQKVDIKKRNVSLEELNRTN